MYPPSSYNWALIKTFGRNPINGIHNNNYYTITYCLTRMPGDLQSYVGSVETEVPSRLCRIIV